MFCTQCGAKLHDDARFCPSCGARISDQKSSNPKPVGKATQPDSPAGNDAKPAEATTTSTTSLKSAVANAQRRSQRRMPLVVLVALALALTSAIAFAACYAYTQYIAPQQTQSNQAQADSEQAAQGKNGGTTANDGDRDRKAAYKLFSDKLQEYLAAYGAPRTSSMGPNLEYVCGLSFASLVDFNKDGMDELICSYCNESSGSVVDTTVEVWAYDNSTETINLVYSGKPRPTTDGGISGIDLIDTGSKVLIKNMEFIPPTPPQYYYQEMSQSEFVENTAIEQRFQSVTLANGESGSESQYYEDGNQIEASEQIFFLSPSNDNSIIASAASSWNKNATWRTPTQVIDLVNETVATLQETD